MRVQFYPKIKVHCWGGFGSQLNALSIVHRLGELFNNRRITLVIHEGGRHNAKFELQDIDLSNFNIELKSDLNSNINIIKNDNKVNRTKIVKYVLRTLGFLNSCDSREYPRFENLVFVSISATRNG